MYMKVWCLTYQYPSNLLLNVLTTKHNNSIPGKNICRRHCWHKKRTKNFINRGWYFLKYMSFETQFCVHFFTIQISVLFIIIQGFFQLDLSAWGISSAVIGCMVLILPGILWRKLLRHRNSKFYCQYLHPILKTLIEANNMFFPLTFSDHNFVRDVVTSSAHSFTITHSS